MEINPDQPVVQRHIDQTPGLRSGKPCVKGTRITVADVVLWTERGMSPDELVTEFPQLTLADVYAALAYYHDNRESIDRQIDESQAFASSLSEATWDDWKLAAEIGRELAAKGHAIPITDLVVAAVSKRTDAAVYSTDPHFDLIPDLKRFHPTS